jgi:hypothetical protein
MSYVPIGTEGTVISTTITASAVTTTTVTSIINKQLVLFIRVIERSSFSKNTIVVVKIAAVTCCIVSYEVMWDNALMLITNNDIML